jgi:hypothetical protein
MDLSSRAWLTTLCVLSWEGDEPSTTAAEQNLTLAIEESAPLPLAKTVAPGAGAMLPEASVVEGK